jgi:cytidine deaminase
MQEALLEAAIAARLQAYAPYSGFFVGAAVLAGGRVFSGCNVENAAYGLTNCAERTAILKAVSEGVRKIEAMAVVADSPGPVSPCGACRQVIAEFATGDVPVYTANLSGMRRTWTVKELLPGAFEARDITETAPR